MANMGSSEWPRASIVEVDKALESWRDSGFDLSTAIGEVVDNSIEASATIVRIRLEEKQRESARTVVRMAFADDGTGIPPAVLPHVLSLGFSTRYNGRRSLGRFGVGMKLGALSQCRRVDVYTKPVGDPGVYRAFLDLDLISSGKQLHIEGTRETDFPSEFGDLLLDSRGKPFASGTLVLWSKVDRLTEGGKYGSGLDERLQELTRFLARAYRRFIDRGLHIELNGRLLSLHDPLFLLRNPRVQKAVEEDVRARIISQDALALDGHNAVVTVSLLPRELRPRRSLGGRQEKFKDLYIPDNQSRVSILRNDREIYYNVIPRFFPQDTIEGGNDAKPDRFIGVEIAFPADLDEYFQVRHVKRGAEPVGKLREELRELVRRPILAARKEIRSDWDLAAAADHMGADNHADSEAAVKSAEASLPRGKAGTNLGGASPDDLVTKALKDLGMDSPDQAARAELVRRKVTEQPITLVDGAWPGQEMLEITHLNGRALVALNHSHPFIRDIYDPLKETAGRAPETLSESETRRLVRQACSGLDILFMAYAKAENMDRSPEDKYSDLRSFWGQFTRAYVQQLGK